VLDLSEDGKEVGTAAPFLKKEENSSARQRTRILLRKTRRNGNVEIRISVRSLVEFILRSGSIDNRKGAAPDNAMAEGGRIHRMIQRRMGSDYQAEVVMRYSWSTPAYDLVVEGRADGVINGDVVTIDEIKGTYRDLEKMKEPVDVHLAQAKCYASMYAREHDSAQMKVRMTYCNMETEELRYFVNTYQRAELDEWFEALLTEYKKWADFTNEWQEQRTASIRQLAFPFSYREGQKELATYVYRSIVHKRKLFIEAPTGVGKTLSTVFPAVKAIGEGKAERIFYLTAKTITRTVADNTFQLLRERQLRFKTVILTAKEKICFMEETECNPGACPYADGHYDRINDAIYDLLLHEDHYNREKVEEYARKYKVCPFEMSLDMSLFSDGIICDYNYVFDPHVYLKRFFTEGVQGQYIFLIDEAHNLVDRGREMYSASLVKEDFLALKKIVREYDGKMEHQLDKCSRELLPLKRECEDCRIVGSIEPFVQAVERLYETMEKYLEEHDESPVREDVLDFFFEISHFLLIYDGLDENYVIYTELEEDDSFMVKLFCVNPSVNLKECMQRARSTVLFSATLLPIQYYKSLLGGEKEDFEVYAKSTFNPKKKALYIGSDVTSKYSRRSPKEYYNIAYYLHEITRMRYGNYLIFFPSHSFLQSVFEVYEENFLDPETEECIIQEDIMSEEDREQFLSRFEGNRNCELEDMIHMDIEVEEEPAWFLRHGRNFQ